MRRREVMFTLGCAVVALSLTVRGAQQPKVPVVAMQVPGASILPSARPADLPFERPPEIPPVLSLRTATSLGLSIPAALAARAADVIE